MSLTNPTEDAIVDVAVEPAEPTVETAGNPPEVADVNEDTTVPAEAESNAPVEASADLSSGHQRAVIEGREHLVADLQNVEIRESGAGNNFFTLSGHAAIFSSLSEPLGGFREILTPGCFRDALGSSLIHLLWNHDARMPLASTDSGTLEVSEDDLGLRVWARIPNDLSYARDIRTLFENGIAKGMSFAFTLPEDGSGETWSRMEDGTPLRTINRMAEIFDVAPVTRGAYSAPGFSMRSVMDNALESGRLEGGSSPVAQVDPVDETVTPSLDAGAIVEQAEALAVRKANFDRRLRIARARTR